MARRRTSSLAGTAITLAWLAPWVAAQRLASGALAGPNRNRHWAALLAEKAIAVQAAGLQAWMEIARQQQAALVAAWSGPTLDDATSLAWWTQRRIDAERIVGAGLGPIAARVEKNARSLARRRSRR